MAWAYAPSGAKVLVHSKIKYLTERAFREIEAPSPFNPGGAFKLDYGPNDTDDEWGYANRAIRGTNRPSNHSWGLAIDLNAQDWPMGQSRNRPPQWLVDIMATHGFAWGGKWRRPDPMHFEFMGTPADADRLSRALLLHDAGVTTPKPVEPPPVNPVPEDVDPVAVRRWMAGVLIGYVGAFPDLNPSAQENNQWHIVRLQQAINLVTGHGLREDGVYGHNTTQAVVNFQRFFKVPLDPTGEDGDFPGAFHRFSRWFMVHILKDIRDQKVG